MEDLDNVESKIAALKKQLDELLHKNNFISTTDVIKISQELDEVLNQYYKLKHKN